MIASVLVLAGMLLRGTPARSDESGAMENDPRLAAWQPDIVTASHRFDVPEDWIRAVILSSAGAMGLMQIMPATWAELRLRYGLGRDPYDPHDNILAGTAYLHELYQRYGYPDLFVAYNAGPGLLDAHLSASKTLPAETLRYLAALGIRRPRPSLPSSEASLSGLFFALETDDRSPLTTSSTKNLFIPLKTAPGYQP